MGSEPGAGAPARGAAPRLLLVGLMGSGKSSVGRAVAARLDVPYLDNDHEIAVLAGEPTVDLARRGGEVLHEWEARYAEALQHRPGPFVAGLPGSSADRPDELTALRRSALLVYLRCDADTLVDRVSHDAPRPWLEAVDPRPFVEATLARRDPVLSSVAQHVVDGAAPLPGVIDAVVRLAQG